jgi:quercetin dioxygenase-like cupin family protein
MTRHLRARLGATILIGLAAAALAAPAAHAGQCPAGQMRPGARTEGMTAPRDVTDTVLASIDVAREPAAIDGREFRLRRLVIQPGGVVPWHSHAERPAIIHVVKGEVVEYASNCAVGITHKAGESVAEKSGISHWWRNESRAPVELLSADLLPVSATPAEKRMM